jgi:glycosyltransferase involved in cell wall biosynthesis
MPTLLSINNYFYRRDGSEAVYLGHNETFAAGGWNVVPFAMQHSENPGSPWSSYFVEEIEFGSAYTFGQKLRRLPKIVYSLEARGKLRSLLTRVRPDICHCHTIYHHLTPSILRPLKQFGVQVVMTLHDLKIACPAYHMFNNGRPCEQCKGGRLHNVIMNRCVKSSLAFSAIVYAEALLHQQLDSYAKNVDRFIVPSQFYARKLAEWGWSPERFVYVPNFVDCARIEPHVEPGRGFLYFGRLSPEKGLLTLVRAAAKAGVRLMIAGTGPQRNELEQAARQAGGDVEFLGHLSGRALIAAIHRSRATVLPSEWYENGPISILESMAAGRPVIGAAIGGIPEHVSDGENGWLFGSGSVDDLARVLRAAADASDAVLTELAKAARRTAEQRFDINIYRRRIESLYLELGVAPPARKQVA